MAMTNWRLILVCLFPAGMLCASPGLSRLPLRFEPGARGSEFIAQAGQFRASVSPTGVSIGPGWMHFLGARGNTPAIPEDLQPGYTNYLLDRDPRKWRTRVPIYGRVRYRNIYPGIDVLYYGNPRELEFDFIVAPGAAVRRIQIAVSSPDLQVRLPRVYQGKDAVKARAVRHGNRISLELADYDRSRPLVIDPVLSYAALFGGGGPDEGLGIAVDASGAAYVVGNAFDGNFPVVNGNSGQYSFLAKLSPAGDALVYSSYLPWSGGGPSRYAVDASGSAYFTRDGAPGFPSVGPAPLAGCSRSAPDVYVAKLSSDGTSLVYAGCIGGHNSDSASAIAVDRAGNAYVTGSTQSPDFPLLHAAQTTHPDSPAINEGFVLKLGADGTLIYSTFLGGGSGDYPFSIAADEAGNAYITGQTLSANFPLKNALQTQRKGTVNTATGFVAKIKADGSDFVYSTYLGGSNGDAGLAIAADGAGNTYVAGSTTSADFPATASALQPRFSGVFAFKSGDGAANWQRSDSGLPAGASSIKIDPGNSSTIYTVSAGTIFKSTDHGATWHATGAPMVENIWIDPADSTLFASIQNGGLLRSRDGGASFTTLNTGFGGFLNGMVFDPTNASVLYARWGGSNSKDGVYKSTDGGDSWQPTALTGSATGSGGLAIDPVHPSTLYASSNHGGLRRSDDGGDTWMSISPSIAAYQLLVDSASKLYAVANGVVLVAAGDGFARKVAPASIGTLTLDPTNSSVWYASTYSSSGNGLYKSTDGGDTWQAVVNGFPSHPALTSLAIDPSSPSTLYAGMAALSDGFFAKLSSDGAALRYSTYLGGTGTDAVNTLAADQAGNVYVAGSTDSADFPLQAAFRASGAGFVAKFDTNNQLVWSSSLGGAAPRAITLGPSGDLYLTGASASAAFATPGAVQQFVPGDFFVSSDGGTAFSGASLTGPPGSIGAVALDPKTPSRVYALSDRLYASSDGGQTWSQLGTLGPSLTTLIVDPQTSENLYAAGFGGFWKSVDGGATWAQVPLIASVPSGPVPSLAIDPKTPSTLYAAPLYPVTILPPNVPPLGILKSTDGGATWNPTGSPPYVTAFTVDPLKPSILYASVSGGAGADSVSKSSDGGATWTTISNGLPIARLLVVDAATPGRIYALGSFPAYGFYRSDDAGITWTTLGAGLPAGQINTLAIDPANASLLYAGSLAGGLYRSTDAGVSWSAVPALRIPIVNGIAIDRSDSSRIYAGAQADPRDVFVMRIVP